jgi:hypothetical protein
MDEIPHDRSIRKMRVLTVALIISGALNIGLVATGVFTQTQEEGSFISIRQVAKNKERVATSLDRSFAQMERLSFHELVSFLTNRDLVDEGYSKRDLALSSLVAFHHFHIDKALGGVSLQRREISLTNGLTVQVFPGLSNDHFEAVIRFAYEEKWPITAEGLLKLIKKGSGLKDESLVQAFLVTPEFRALQAVFKNTEVSQHCTELLNLVCEGTWELFDQFAKEQAQLLDLSVERRRSLLLGYLAIGSKTAAHLLLTTDFAFIAKRLEDKGIIGMLSLLTEKSAESERLCMELLKSPRSDAVWESAARTLYAYNGEEVSSPVNLQAAREKFIGAAPLPKPAVTQPVISAPQITHAPKLREHIVKEGESLWKIARQYNVKVDEIVKVNEMEKDRLFPGMVLRIP